MQFNLLNIIVCPACRGSLEIKNGSKVCASKIISGNLVCAACRESYPVKNGIPRFIISPKDNIADSKLLKNTRERFSFSWKIFSKHEFEEKWNKDSYQYLEKMPLEFLVHGQKTILDLGCGMGSDMPRFAKTNTMVVGVDIADSLEVASERFKGQTNVELIQADIYNLPFKNDSFDLIYCLGVLHHLPNIKQAFKKMVDLTKKNGAVLVYLYEDFSDRGVLLRLLLCLVNIVRFATRHMNARILYICCLLFSPFIWIIFCLPVFLLKKVGFTGLSRMLPFRHTLNLNCVVSDLYDRFSPPIENRYSEQQVTSLFKEFNLSRIHTFKYRGWVAIGVKQDGA